MSELRCVICGKPVERRPANPHYPFCSDRCRLIDLGKWLNEDYRVAAEPSEFDELPDELSREGSGEDEHDGEH